MRILQRHFADKLFPAGSGRVIPAAAVLQLLLQVMPVVFESIGLSRAPVPVHVNGISSALPDPALPAAFGSPGRPNGVVERHALVVN